MILWKRRKFNYPQIEFNGEKYYLVRPSDIHNLDDVKVKFEGVIQGKPEIEYYAAGWPWSISSRIIEKDHGHLTTLNVSGVKVYFKGIAIFKVGEKVTVYGKVENGEVKANVIESENTIFKST